MNIKASIVVMSHLSDIQECLSSIPMGKRINFIKYIILDCKGDLTQEIDADELYAKFTAPKVELTEMKFDEIPAFVTDEMMLEISKRILNREKLSAIKYLCDEAKKQGKHISLYDGKKYADDMQRFLEIKPNVTKEDLDRFSEMDKEKLRFI